MYLEEDGCAHCRHRPLIPELRLKTLHDPKFRRVRLSTLLPPFFCSERCFALACQRFYHFDPSKYVLPPGEEQIWKLVTHDVERTPEGHSTTYSDSPQFYIPFKDKIATLENDGKRAALAAWDAAYSQYQKAWQSAHDAQHKEEQAKRRAKVDEQIAEIDQEWELRKERPIPEEVRFEHSMCLGPSRSGKTTLLQEQFLRDMEQPNPPAYVIIDPKGLLVERISRLQIFDPDKGRLRDRLVIIDPTLEPLPALGMFDIPNGAPASYQSKLLETFSYIFSTAGAPLTQRQSIPFGYVVRLVFHLGGDIDTLMDVLEDKETTRRFATAIGDFVQTDSGAERFFRNDFYSREFEPTRQQIKTRLHEIISRPALKDTLGAKRNRLSIYECIKQRKVVCVNTGLGHLGVSGSSTFGRWIIAQTLAATFARQERSPVFLMIDEFQDYCDEYQTPRMLRLAGEYKLGISVFFQAMHSMEITEAMRTAISTNTSIKYSASPEGNDLSFMATAMRCDKEFLQKVQKTETHAQFATYVRGIGLQHPFITSVPLGNIQKQPQMSDASYRRLLHTNAMMLADEPEPPRVRSATPRPAKPKQDDDGWA